MFSSELDLASIELEKEKGGTNVEISSLSNGATLYYLTIPSISGNFDPDL